MQNSSEKTFELTDYIDAIYKELALIRNILVLLANTQIRDIPENIITEISNSLLIRIDIIENHLESHLNELRFDVCNNRDTMVI